MTSTQHFTCGRAHRRNQASKLRIHMADQAHASGDGNAARQRQAGLLPFNDASIRNARKGAQQEGQGASSDHQVREYTRAAPVDQTIKHAGTGIGASGGHVYRF